MSRLFQRDDGFTGPDVYVFYARPGSKPKDKKPLSEINQVRAAIDASKVCIAFQIEPGNHFTGAVTLADALNKFLHDKVGKEKVFAFGIHTDPSVAIEACIANSKTKTPKKGSKRRLISFLLFYHDDSILDRAIEDTLREIISTALEKPARQKMFEARVRLTSINPLRVCAPDSEQLDIIRQLNHITTILLNRNWYMSHEGSAVFLQVTKAQAAQVMSHFENSGIKGFTQKQAPLDASQVLIMLSPIPSLDQLKGITMMVENDEQAAETSAVNVSAIGASC